MNDSYFSPEWIATKVGSEFLTSRRLLGFLTRAAPNQVFLALILGVFAGAAYTLIIPIITTTLALATDLNLPKVADKRVVFGFEVSSPKMALAFFALCGFIFVARTASQVLLQSVSLNATRSLRLAVYKRVSSMPIDTIERIGASRIHASIANDIPQIMAGADPLAQVNWVSKAQLNDSSHFTVAELLPLPTLNWWA